MYQPTRRQMLHTTTAAALLGSTSRPGHALAAAGDATKLPTPTTAQVRWQQCELGVIYHLDMPIIAGVDAPNNLVKETFDPKIYNPTKLDTDQWVAAAKAAGAKYAVFTGTHFNGFMQWQSDLYPYGLKQAAWRGGKGDIVGDFVESCRNQGIEPGVYFSTHRNAYQTVWGHYVDWGKGKGTAKQAAYNRIAEKQTEEICSRYGRLVQIWYDAGVKTPKAGGPDVLPIFEKHQPDSIFYSSSDRSDIRWIGNEAGHAGYPCWSTMPGRQRGGGVSHNTPSWRKCLHGGDANGTVWAPGMVDVPLRGHKAHDWLYRPGHDHSQESVERLMTMYDQSVGRNSNFIIGLVVDPEGQVPEPDMKRMQEFGQALRQRFSRPAGQTSGRGDSVTLKLPSPRRIDQVVIQEDITHGERVRRYTLEGLTGTDTWQKLAEGESVGNKRIERIKPIEVAAVRLHITERQAEPIISNLQVFEPVA
ncbi:alpha-L-fucosidase [Planctomycetales bacterium ZRK34]|nr:alpha-L-fucosidase [Planctomycetales bacterium ZRK34]